MLPSNQANPTKFEGHADVWRIALILGLTLVVRCWVVSHTEVTARDSIGFIRYAMQFESPPPDPLDPTRTLTRLEVLQRAEHPPGYYLSVLLVSYPVRAIKGTNCDSMVLSTQLTSVLAALLLTLPMYYLGCRVFDRQTAFVATLLFQSLPVWAQVSSDGLTDSLYLFAACSTLFLGTWALDRASAIRFALAGLGSGIAYLIRPEGVLLGIALGMTIASAMLARRYSVWKGMEYGGAALVGALLVALPYVLMIGKLTNKPSGNALQLRMLGKEAPASWKERDQTSLEGSAAGVLFGAWWSETHNQQDSRVLWSLRNLVTEIAKTFHYLPPMFAMLGLIVLGGSTWRKLSGRLLIVQLVIYLCVLFLLPLLVGYLSERHTLIVALLGSFFAAAVLPIWGVWLSRLPKVGDCLTPTRWAALAAAVLILMSFPAGFKSLHANRAGHHAAGTWLAANAQPDEMIWDPFAWAEFYSGRTLRYADPKRFADLGKKPVYTIVEPQNTSPHSRLPMIPFSNDIAKIGKVVWQWPEGPKEKAKVVVYRWDPRGEE